ncbi:hypothetical protein [Pseudomonas mandelii]|jgi:hypothetical protein|uniref:hypothetical protein n=1 Tax=Pseudomonas mandelii TaxID=75612 RepID=UPI003D038CE0
MNDKDNNDDKSTRKPWKRNNTRSATSSTSISSIVTGSSNVFINSSSSTTTPAFETAQDPSSLSGDVGKKIDEYIELALGAVSTRVDTLYRERMVLITQSEKKLATMIGESTRHLASLEKQLETITKLTDQSADTQSNLQDEVKYIKGNAISALAIFVSFFAFITITLNVFSKAGSVVSAAVLVLIFWCLLIGFNLIIAIQFKVLSNSKVIWACLGGVIFLSISSILALYYFSPELRGVKIIFQMAT